MRPRAPAGNPVPSGVRAHGSTSHQPTTSSSSSTRPPIHQLSRPTVQQCDQEEEEEYGPEFSVDEFGKYFESEVKDVRRQGLDAAAGAGAGAGAGEQRAEGRASSIGSTTHPIGVSNLNPSEQAIINRPTATATATAARPSQTSNLPAKRPFIRVPSVGGDARRQAIGAALSQSSAAASQQGWSVPMAAGASHGAQGTGGRERERERPSVAAGVGNQEIEELRKQVAQVRFFFFSRAPSLAGWADADGALGG